MTWISCTVGNLFPVTAGNSVSAGGRQKPQLASDASLALQPHHFSCLQAEQIGHSAINSFDNGLLYRRKNIYIS